MNIRFMRTVCESSLQRLKFCVNVQGVAPARRTGLEEMAPWGHQPGILTWILHLSPLVHAAGVEGGEGGSPRAPDR